jgi:hypothetical protein
MQGSMTDMLGKSGRLGTSGNEYSSVKHIPHRKCRPMGSKPRRWRKRSINRVRHCKLLEPMYYTGYQLAYQSERRRPSADLDTMRRLISIHHHVRTIIALPVSATLWSALALLVRALNPRRKSVFVSRYRQRRRGRVLRHERGRRALLTRNGSSTLHW